MSQSTSVVQNASEWQIRGEIDLSNAAAVLAVRGDNLTAVKTGAGTYTVTLKGTQALRLVEILRRAANYTASAPATALGVRVSTVVQSATTDDIVITFVTTALPTSGAATDGTAATTISFEVVLRTNQYQSVI